MTELENLEKLSDDVSDLIGRAEKLYGGILGRINEIDADNYRADFPSE